MPSVVFVYTLFLAAVLSVLSAPLLANTPLPKRINLSTALIPPYQYLDAQQQLTGIATEQVRCIMNKLNIETELSVLPWNRAQKRVKDNRSDGFFIASENDQRNAYATLSAPLVQGDWLWYQQPDSQWVSGTESFRKNARVGTTVGTNMHYWLKNSHDKVTTHENLSVLFKMLNRGLLDAVLSRQDMLDANHQKLHLQSIMATTTAQYRPLGVYFNKHFLKRYPALLPRFNAAIPDCRP
ncbi:transporter substrate-binding domain-containing protein [Aestuariirhabdus sp. Z084]|uniref:substrate-binding periplasmic protein n=1 Tax=Aestuariirhabdus haliotis TaxID=2918751 RepID=UPI00201B3C27|nr:transporter substrate-binding domain-containing protein [Aestuariirhabdus haliotis]MCL6416526.1 transporter substrate-binding domain-containing protein [Aestuariirhabdus haliotis]MCL6420516.1 transporter substrate-binding domain-containing protein [Aestuariirhabdus haliotis]